MIFVGGVSGSGKTTQIRNLISRRPDFTHIKASTILRSAKRPISNLTAEEAQENQLTILDCLVRFPPPERALLDGHGMIPLGAMAGLYYVPTSFFRQLRLSAIVCVTASPEDLLARRRWPAEFGSLPAIQELQELETRHLRDCAMDIACAFYVAQSSDKLALYNLLRPHLS